MQIDFSRLTKNARDAIRKSMVFGQHKDLRKLDAICLLKALIEQKGSLGNVIIEETSAFDEISGKISRNGGGSMLKINMSVFEVLVKSFQIAASSGSCHIGTEHLVYGLISVMPEKHKRLFSQSLKKDIEKKNGQTIASLGNRSQRPMPPDFIQEMNMLINSFFSQTRNGTAKDSFIGNFCIDLNSLVKKQKHILVGRQDDLERISNILGRKMKNNPVLVGDPGVGKTAIVEGLAQRINEGKAPFYLSNKKIMSLDLGLLVAGTNFRGEFESRLKEVVNEARNNPDMILFIDEIHNLVGAGNAVGGMDAANLLKPALSRGEIQVIGATTFEEYRKHIEKDTALERRFQPVIIGEPTPEETLEILKGIRPNYENYHNIKISDKALETASSLAKKYFTERFLPDSAIDLIDESSAQIRSKFSNSELYQKIRQKKNELDNVIGNKESLVISDRYEEAIHLRKVEKDLEKEIEGLKKKLGDFEKKNPIELTEKEILKTISISAQVPLSLLSKETRDVPMKTKRLMENNLVGQKEIIKKIYHTLIRQFSGISNPDRPLGSFLFIGPSGVGKTLTAKLLSEAISPFGKSNLVQINMSEFMEKHSVSRLLGSPAGYVGYDESSELTEKIRRNPYCVVLFDEIEKADSNVLNILLQILEEGKITNAKGRVINFKNAIIILTSNIGTDRLNKVSQIGFESGEKIAKKERQEIEIAIQKEISDMLPGELTNRLDNILIFNHLTKKDIEKIVKKEIDKLVLRIKKCGLEVSVEKDAIKLLAEKSFDPKQGARLVRRQLEENIEPLAAEIISKKKNKKSKIEIVASNKRIIAKAK